MFKFLIINTIIVMLTSDLINNLNSLLNRNQTSYSLEELLNLLPIEYGSNYSIAIYSPTELSLIDNSQWIEDINDYYSHTFVGEDLLTCAAYAVMYWINFKNND